MVHDAVEAIGARHRRKIGAIVALLCCVGLLGACGGSDGSTAPQPKNVAARGVGSVRAADCTDWKKGTVDERRVTVAHLRRFAGGPVGSSAGIKYGPVLDNGRAYRVLDSYCSKYFARGFKLYKLYERAAAFVGH